MTSALGSSCKQVEWRRVRVAAKKRRKFDFARIAPKIVVANTAGQDQIGSVTFCGARVVFIGPIVARSRQSQNDVPCELVASPQSVKDKIEDARRSA